MGDILIHENLFVSNLLDKKPSTTAEIKSTISTKTEATATAAPCNLQSMDNEELAACMVIAAYQYLYGISGVQRDINTAVRLFRTSAALGNAAAQYMFAACCCDHLVDPESDDPYDPLLMNFKGAPTDDADVLLVLNATYWYRAAAVQGHAAAQNELGVLLFHGGRLREIRRQSRANVPAAVCIFPGGHHREAGALRTRPEFTAMLDGPDEPLACMWFRRAAEAGHAGAMYNLACCLENGRGVPVPDITEAAQWYLKSAMNNHDDAAIRLCRLLLASRGDYVTESPQQRRRGAFADPTAAVVVVEQKDLRVRGERAIAWLHENAPAGHPNVASLVGFIEEAMPSSDK